MSLSERAGKDGRGCAEEDGVAGDLMGETGLNFKGEGKGDEHSSGRDTRQRHRKTHTDIK